MGGPHAPNAPRLQLAWKHDFARLFRLACVDTLMHDGALRRACTALRGLLWSQVRKLSVTSISCTLGLDGDGAESARWVFLTSGSGSSGVALFASAAGHPLGHGRPISEAACGGRPTDASPRWNKGMALLCVIDGPPKTCDCCATLTRTTTQRFHLQ